MTTGAGLVDVHHHLYPPFFLERLGAAGLAAPAVAAWTPARALEDMDASGIALAITSLTSTGVELFSADEGRRLARDSNEFGARMMADFPGRFGLFGLVPLPDIDGALAEIGYLLDVLGADGICLFTSYGNRWLGDAVYEPVMAELNRRAAVVFVHPTVPDGHRGLLPGVPDFTIEFPTDTARAVTSLVLSGMAARHPDIRFIFAHAGGTLPVLSDQIVRLARGDAAAQLRRFHYDTALRAQPTGLAAIRALVDRSQILYGTDFPFRTGRSQSDGLDTCGVTGGEMAAIGRDNALRLMPHRHG